MSQQGILVNELKLKMKKAEEDRIRTRDLEKKCKLLEETIKARNPNSLPMLIEASQKVHKAEEDDTTKK